jgi:type II secretory pathway pseudopilin PulG
MSCKKKLRRGFTFVELATVVLIVVVVLALLAPWIRQGQQDARRTACKNNLKQIGLAMHYYHETFGTFPPAWTNHHAVAGKGGRYGWQTFLTPFIDQAPLYQRLNFSDQKPEKARKLLEKVIPPYRCPADATDALNPFRDKFATSNYSANFGTVSPPRWLDSKMSFNWPGQAPTPTKTDGICWFNSNCKISDIIDGVSNTFMVGERSIAGGAGIWMGVRGNNFESDQVTDLSPGNEINTGTNSFSSTHFGGVHFLMCDGSVRYVSEKIESGIGADGVPKTYQRLGSRNDRMPVGEY